MLYVLSRSFLLKTHFFKYLHYIYNYLYYKGHKGGEMMQNILLTRIDNRLIHGQAGVTWTKTLGANLLMV